jgi:6-pyruvoyltetrahydropterin/6-carboxytetrahydropterin synthase
VTDYALSYDAYFDASHDEPAVPACNRLHGHTYHVTVTVSGNLEPDEHDVHRVQWYETLESLLTVAGELDHRHLNDMLPGVVTIPETLAAWFLERFPYAEYVEVKQGWRGPTGRATRRKR